MNNTNQATYSQTK